MWFLLMIVLAVLSILGFCYVAGRMTRFFSGRPRKQAWGISLGILLAVMAGIFLYGGLWNTMVAFIHLLLAWLAADGICLLLEKQRKKPFARYYAGFVAIIVTVCYLGVGVYLAHHVYRTEYTLAEDAGEHFRIVGFSDSHVGTTFHADKFPEYVEAINRENPDIVVIVGDFVDDDTSFEDMVGSCEALAGLKTKYGVYYVFGNHDCGYYGDAYRGYGKAELVENLTKNNITVLEDAVVPLAGDLYLCGRQDSQQTGRASMQELMQGLPENARAVVLDHEPNDYAAEKEARAALVLSGHTHGGQLIPINKVGEWFGINDMTYGHRKDGNTDFIVSSGISCWAFKIKTGCISEYFVVDLDGVAE